MCKIYHLILFIASIGISINCQGHGGGGGGGGGGGRGHGSRRGGKGSDTYICILLVLLAICLFYEYIVKGQPFKSNSRFVSSNPEELRQLHDTHLFRSGIWLSYYYQYQKWHGPYELSLTFNLEFQEVTGSGWDDVGRFSIDGIYSCKTHRIALRKIYCKGTGNSLENVGHKAIIQLTQSSLTNRFIGKWYIRTCKYRGENKFILKQKSENEHENDFLTIPETWV